MSLSWYVVHLGEANLAQPQLMELESRLAALYLQAGECPDMLALFCHESKELHCHTLLFVSEAFQHLAQLDDAVLCTQPNHSGISYLAGNHQWWKRDYEL